MKRNICTLLLVLLSLAGVYSASAQITNLEITSSEGKGIILIPTALTNLVLQSATDLVASNWTAVTDGTSVVAVSVPIAGPGRYFRLYNPAASANYGMNLIPAGSFQMGDNFNEENGTSGDAPVVTNYVSNFDIDTNLVTLTQWQTIYKYATNLGYSFANAGTGKDTNHPVVGIDWYDCVKWCNARSQKNGLSPMYYTDSGLTMVYTNGEIDTLYVKWSASGYRLPTEAEWEKAARGGVNGHRFPFGNTISESQANYQSITQYYSYDQGPNGFNVAYQYGSYPYTSPVGSFAANGYGLCDMAGDAMEWVYDWYYPDYSFTMGSDPTGPYSGSNRVQRGGAWNNDASGVRCARRFNDHPNTAGNYLGFRCVARF